MICVECSKEFERPRKSKRQTCSRACWAALGWKSNRDDRIASITAQKRTPEGRAASVETNRKRWSRPGEREKLAEYNRRRWAQPEIKFALSAAIRDGWTLERRAEFAAFRARQWAEDEAYRAKNVAAIRAAKSTPEARAKFSALLTARWRDPKSRAVYVAAMQRRVADPVERRKFSVAMKRRWDDPAARNKLMRAAALRWPKKVVLVAAREFTRDRLTRGVMLPEGEIARLPWAAIRRLCEAEGLAFTGSVEALNVRRVARRMPVVALA